MIQGLLAFLLLLPTAQAQAEAVGDPLEDALAAVRAEALQADVSFLADDQLEGRDTPSLGLQVAALYIRARLERLGFETAGGEGWFAPFRLSNRALDGEASSLVLATDLRELRLVFGRDYFLSRMSHVAERTVEGPLVSVGQGRGGDFAGTDLEGKIAVLFDRGASMTRALRNAKKRGAVGLMLVEADPEATPYAERFANTTRLATQTRLIGPTDGTSKSRAEEDPALLLLSPAAAEMLLAFASASWPGEHPPAGLEFGVRAREERVLARADVVVPNVAGFWRGSDPELSKEVIVVSAHYDHVGVRGGEVYNGADDNASGTAGLLAVAEALVRYGPLKRSVVLLWLAGEEKGLWGSAAWTLDPQLPPGHAPVADLNIDMIGRTAPGELYLTPTRAHAAFNAVSQAAYELAPLEGFAELLSQDADWARSDHFNFDRTLGIPVAFLSSGEHADYHEPSDDADKIDYDKMTRVTRLIVRMLDRIQAAPLEHTGDGAK